MYSKYHARKVEVDGIKFDSKRESARYQVLKMLETAEKIQDLERQVCFTLIPSEPDRSGKKQRPVRYYADFTYTDSYGRYHVEDSKGMRTPVYKLKKRLMWHMLKIQVEEV